MATVKNNSNEGTGGSVKHLDTKNFNDTIIAYRSQIKQFESIVTGVNKTTKTVNERWRGKGRDAFEKDCKQIQLNLKDISDIMNNISDALSNAYEEYKSADAELSQSFQS